MKKLLLLLAFAATATAANAQARAGGNLTSKDYTGGKTTDSRNTGFGIKGGYNYANVYGNGTKDADLSAYNGFHAGVYGQLGFSQFSSLQVELLYSRKGFKSTSDNVRLDYLSLPILYVGNITETISFHIGPEISLLTKVLEGSTQYDLKENGFNSVDYGAVAGLEARLGPARVGARYDLGFGKIFDDTSAKSLVKDRVSNGTVQVYVGIGFTQ